MMSKNRVTTMILGFLLVLSTVTAYAQEHEPSRNFVGIWIRKPMESERFDPFTPDFVMIDRIDGIYLVVFVNSRIEGDRLLAESFQHLYRDEGVSLISSGMRISRRSTLYLSSSGELVEVIEIPEIGESGENIYVRPTIGDFSAMIEWYGYKLKN